MAQAFDRYDQDLEHRLGSEVLNMGIAVKLAYDARDIVGESIIWAEAEKAVYWVDIVGQRIQRFEPERGLYQFWETPELVTSIGLARGGKFIVGLRSRVCLWSPGSQFETLAVPEPDRPENRLNEGVVAPDGSFWVGTMLDNIGPAGEPVEITKNTGALYRIAPDGGVTQLTENTFGITNTMIWPDESTFITADTLVNTLFTYHYNSKAHKLSGRQEIAAGIDRGLPDGSCMIAGGGKFLNCRTAGGKSVIEISADGCSVRCFDLPCQSPTSCTFGGENYSTLFVTSARFGTDKTYLTDHPEEGGLFAVTMGTVGKPGNVYDNSRA